MRAIKHLNPSLNLVKVFLFSVSMLGMSIANAETIEGRVIKVADGDTITVLTENKQQVKIRLAGIDTPERGQPFYRKAKDYTSNMVFLRQVVVHVDNKDRYNRLIGRVVLPNGSELNKLLVEAGFAWWYKRYAKKNKELFQLETQARQAKRGLWADKNPVPPWAWRKNKRTKKKN